MTLGDPLTRTWNKKKRSIRPRKLFHTSFRVFLRYYIYASKLDMVDTWTWDDLIYETIGVN